MSEQITTAADLDALPVGSVVLDKGGHAWQQTATGVWASHTQGRHVWDSWNLPMWRGPFTLLYRPDAPVAAGATVRACGQFCRV